MGSYISIVNTTQHDWRCAIGKDEKALKITSIILAGISAVATTIVSAGMIAPLVASVTAPNVLTVVGTTTAATTGVSAATIARLVTNGLSISNSAFTISSGIQDVLGNRGFELIRRHDDHRWGKMPLMMWQQATCVRSYTVNQRLVRTETLVIRPIFSAKTPNGNNRYYLGNYETNVQVHDLVIGDEARRLQMANETQEEHHVIEYSANQTNEVILDQLEVGDVILIYP